MDARRARQKRRGRADLLRTKEIARRFERNRRFERMEAHSTKGQVNAYRCARCGGDTITIDVDAGATPFVLACRATGRVGDCNGVARSQGYRTTYTPAMAMWEWYAPTTMGGLAPTEREHVRHGGLLLRRRVVVVPRDPVHAATQVNA